MVAFAISALFIKEKCAHIDDDPPKLNLQFFFVCKTSRIQICKATIIQPKFTCDECDTFLSFLTYSQNKINGLFIFLKGNLYDKDQFSSEIGWMLKIVL